MTSPTHSPWRYDYTSGSDGIAEFLILGPDNAHIATVGPDPERGIVGATVEANARLIASATELLETGGDLIDALLTASPLTTYPRVVQDVMAAWIGVRARVEGHPL